MKILPRLISWALQCAVQAFGRAAELDPGRMLPHTQSGLLYMALGELPAAETAFAAALALQPGHPTALTGLSATLLASARRAAAQGAPGGDQDLGFREQQQ